MKFVNFKIARAFRISEHPLKLAPDLSLSQSGVYILENRSAAEILRYYLANDWRWVIYLPEAEGEKEAGAALLSLQEGDSLAGIKEKLYALKENIGKLLFFSRPYLTPAELLKVLKEYPEVFLVLVKGWRNLLAPGEKGEAGQVLRELKKAANLCAVAVVLLSEPGLPKEAIW